MKPHKNAPKRVLVTGGAGFIGSHLVDRLIQAGCAVICMDNLETGSEGNLAHLHGHPRFTFLRHDISNPFSAEVDEIYNLACPASPQQYQRDPIGTTRTSVLGALNVLELARGSQCKVLQASTSEVYGDPLVDPQSESYWGNVSPIGPRACYNEGKRCAESLFFDYRRQHGVAIKVARIFNTYGPRMAVADGRVVSNFITCALRNLPITIYGDGKQTRAFCFVDDTVDGLLRLMATEPAQYGPINLGNPAAISVRDLAERVIAMTGAQSSVTYLDLPEDDPKQRRPDISLAKGILGWEPRISLEEGLARSITYFREILSRPAD